MPAPPESASLRWWQWLYAAPLACLALLWRLLRVLLRLGGIASLLS